ncbi:MAG: hypothetical protein L0Y60_04060 [Beijerinckiaceae bacterium]|nr:hypothetical protein [Beijerinckiaceae bacterium]
MERILSESALLERESTIDARVAILREEIASLTEEKSKIQAAKELFSVFNITNENNELSEREHPSEQVTDGLIRPEGIPSTRDMIIWVVRDFNASDKAPTTMQIVESIRKKCWPNAPSNRIRPMIWSLWKTKGILTRRKERYYAEPAEKDEAPSD